MQSLEIRPAIRGANPPERSVPIRRTLVAYGSRFGNTERLASALARGLLKVPGTEVDCLPIAEVRPEELGRYDLIAIGGPTEIMSASHAMKEFLAKLPRTGLAGKAGFAFDTRLGAPLSGSAARFIQRHLDRHGLVRARSPASVIVRGMTKEERARYGDEGAPEWARKLQGPPGTRPSGPFRVDLLPPGVLDDFEKIGAEIGAALMSPRA